MAVLLLGLHAFGVFFGERVQAGGGLGWDGTVYARIIRQLPYLLEADQIAPYYGHRLLPLAIARVIDREDIIMAFQAINFVASFVSLWAWLRISKHFGLNPASQWIGVAGLFLSFQAAKMGHFDPVLIDTFTIAVALVMIVLFVENRRALLIIWTIVASLSWTTGAITGVLLVCLLGGSGKPWRTPTWSIAITASVISLTVVGYLTLWVPPVCSFSNDLLSPFVEQARAGDGVCGALRALMTAGASIAVVAYASTHIFGVPRGVRPVNVLLGVATLLATIALNITLTNADVAGGTGLPLLAKFILLPQGGMFFLPFVSAVVFWGPVALLTILWWPDVVRRTWEVGPGFVAAVALGLPLTLVTEPRFVTFQWPFIVLATVLAVRERINRQFLILFGVIVVLFSKVWLRINYTRWLGGDFEGLDRLPKQMFFGNLGFWMSWPAFIVHALVSLAVGALLHRWLGSGPHTENRQRKTPARYG
jgi:hypothetical protein